MPLREYLAGVRDTGERIARARGYAIQRFGSCVPAGVLLPLFLLVLATVLTAGVLKTSAETTTPGSDASADPQSTITVRFFNGGQPVTIILAGPNISADGVGCALAHPAALSTVSQYSMEWPLAPSSVPECEKGPPTLVGFDFVMGSPAGDEILRLSVEANWQGNDLVFDLSIPDRFVFAPAANPNGLPSGGGPPEAGSTPAITLLILGAALLAVSSAVVFSQRPKPSTMPDDSRGGK